MKGNNRNEAALMELSVSDGHFDFSSTISTALTNAELELSSVEETIESIKVIKPECDKLDYILSASSGALCGIIDVFLVGKPGESPIGDLTDKWFANRTIDFAKLCGYKVKDNCKDPLHDAIEFLEGEFKVPYDQTVGKGIFKELLNLTPNNHHFKSLSHNPTLLGLFFSILNQFNNTSSFVADGELITLVNSDNKFELQGGNIPAKIFCGFVNWFGHIMSDVSGFHRSKGRGMGIPSPIWSWTNDVIAIKRKLNIPVSDFDKSINEFSLKLFEQGYDVRFQSAQMIPVLINELLVRFLYSVRRIIKWFAEKDKHSGSFRELWDCCEPFKNATVKRMLTIAHGSFCLIDITDATVRGFATGAGTFNPVEFFMRLNIIGVGRFTISLYGETKRGIQARKAESEKVFLIREKTIIEEYISGLRLLSVIYDDQDLVNFSDDFYKSDLYKQAFEKTVALAEKRDVPEHKILKNKADIDSYFRS